MNVAEDDAQQRAAQQKIVFARLAYSRQVFEASLVSGGEKGKAGREGLREGGEAARGVRGQERWDVHGVMLRKGRERNGRGRKTERIEGRKAWRRRGCVVLTVERQGG